MPKFNRSQLLEMAEQNQSWRWWDGFSCDLPPKEDTDNGYWRVEQLQGKVNEGQKDEYQIILERIHHCEYSIKLRNDGKLIGYTRDPFYSRKIKNLFLKWERKKLGSTEDWS